MVFCLANVNAQTKYYTVKSIIDVTDWRDEQFVLKVSNPSTQAEIANELQIPFMSRSKIVLGDLSNGSGGFNKNGTHCFNWHMIDDTITLVDSTVELCDGRPFSDTEEGDFLNTVGYFCPWSMRVFEEIVIPPNCTLSTYDYEDFLNIGSVFPNPANDTIHIKIINGSYNNMQVAIFNTLGELLYFEKKPFLINHIDSSQLKVGTYIIIVTLDSNNYYTQFIKN